MLLVFDNFPADPAAPTTLPLKLVEAQAFPVSADAVDPADTAAPPPVPLRLGRPLVAAHRGASLEAPENTMAAFRLAVELGADYLELDVQRSSDGRLVVIHDATVDRTTDGSGEVGRLPYAVLRTLDAGSWFGKQYAGERIPSLDEVLDTYLGRTGLLLELKNPDSYPGIVEQLSDELAVRLRRSPESASRLIVQSFDHGAVRRFHEKLPTVATAVLTSGRGELRLAKLREYAGYASYVNAHIGDLTLKASGRLHALGMKTFVWTVHTRRQARKLGHLGISGVVTDNPAAFLPNAKQPDDTRQALRTPAKRIVRLLRHAAARMA